MHVAILAGTDHGADAVLDEAVAAVRASSGRITIGAVCEPARLSWGIGFPGAGLAPAQLIESDRSAACSLARRLLERLPPDVDATHAGFLGWRCPELRAFLRTARADRVLVVGGPFSPIARWTLQRRCKSIAA
jgi:hypothetical protein